jgi:hypothetical protein
MHSTSGYPNTLSRRIVTLLALVQIPFTLWQLPLPAHGETIDLETQVVLQTALREYIHSKSGGGRYTHFDEASGNVQTLTLKRIHPIILRLQDRFMLCADFTNAAGDSVVIDYIFAPHRTGYRVEKEIAGRRSLLVKMFEKVY